MLNLIVWVAILFVTRFLVTGKKNFESSACISAAAYCAAACSGVIDFFIMTVIFMVVYLSVKWVLFCLKFGEKGISFEISKPNKPELILLAIALIIYAVYLTEIHPIIYACV